MQYDPLTVAMQDFAIGISKLNRTCAACAPISQLAIAEACKGQRQS
jgi:hypothetical protein